MKAEHKELLRQRAQKAIKSLYHNATPVFGVNFNSHGKDDDYVWDWFQTYASIELDSLNRGDFKAGRWIDFL
jgi:hypothetical protein